MAKTEDNRTEAQKALGIHPGKELSTDEDTVGPKADAVDEDMTDADDDESLESHDESDGEDDDAASDEDESAEFVPEPPKKKKEGETGVDSDEDEDDENAQTVPLKRLLDEKKARKEDKKVLEDRIAALEAKYGEKASEELTAQMAKELQITPEAAQKLLEYSTKAVLMGLEKEGRILTPELKAKLEAFTKQEEKEVDPKAEKEKAEKREIQYFSEEWQDFLPALKKQYSNATPAMLKEAAQEMYRKARSRDYGNVPGVHPAYPLDYIFFKEKKAFDTILRVSPKNASAPTNSHDVETEDVKIDFTDPNLTPAQYQRFKAQQNAKQVARNKASGGIKFQ